MTSHSGLRQRLTELLDEGLSVGEFEGKLQDLKCEFGHQIETETGLGIETTCIPYALNLSDNDLYRAIARHSNREHTTAKRKADDIFASPEFMNWLISENLLQGPIENAAAYSTLVVYLEAGMCRHVGIWMEDARVSSKWGEWPVYRHPLWELPSIYGDAVALFRRPTSSESLELFLNFARHKGLTDEQLNLLSGKSLDRI